ncbi:MAG: acyl carrier protein [Planctomycetes bacterium]|nr:acyl carrier protein [Planctomycetota bacterium]
MPSQEELERELKELIVTALALEDIRPGDIDSHAPLFGSGLGLDSIDALELVMVLQRKYGFKASEIPGFSRECFGSIDRLAAFVSTQLQQA